MCEELTSTGLRIPVFSITKRVTMCTQRSLTIYCFDSFFLAFPTPNVTFYVGFFLWLQLAWSILAKQKCIASGSVEVTAPLWHQSITLTISKRITESFPAPLEDLWRVWHAWSSPASLFFPNPGLSGSSSSPGEKTTQKQQGGNRRDLSHAQVPLCQCWHNWQRCLRLSLCACCVLISSNPFLHRLLVKGNHIIQLSQPDILLPKSLFHSHLHLLQEQQTLTHSWGSWNKTPANSNPIVH